jgi:hypothetical protein
MSVCGSVSRRPCSRCVIAREDGRDDRIREREEKRGIEEEKRTEASVTEEREENRGIGDRGERIEEKRGVLFHDESLCRDVHLGDQPTELHGLVLWCGGCGGCGGVVVLWCCSDVA